VSPTAGTTRDWIEEEIEIDGLPVRLIDTAGWHASQDPLEIAAIDAGSKSAQSADLFLLVIDHSASLPDLGAFRLPPGTIIAANKADLPAAWELGEFSGPSDSEIIRVSAGNGLGIPDLTHRLLRRVLPDGFADEDPCLFTSRQADLARKADVLLEDGRCSEASHHLKQEFIGSP
jgi:tRNA modification GTPase